jgi:hypothetical protein
MASFSNSLSRDYPQSDTPFRAAETGGPNPFFHDQLDQLRSQWRSTPEATYPDGYLGTINTRRQDRLLNGLKQRSGAKPYTRGIHKGERRDPSDYMWPEEFNLFTGLELQSSKNPVKFTPPGLGLEVGQLLVNDGKNPDDWKRHGSDPDRTEHLRRMAPPWAGRGMGMAIAYPGR